MNCLGNIIWWILGGLFAAIWYFFGGILFCLTIIGIPVGLQCFKLSQLMLAPFGAKVVDNPDSGILDLVCNIIWIIFFGWELAIAHLVSGLLFCISIIGIPWGLQHFKFALLAFFPFGKKVV